MSLILSYRSFAELSVDVYGNDKSASRLADERAAEMFLEDHFSSSSEYNYYENNALNPYQSLFLDGVDQRFLELDYNGFSLRDPSHPSGVFNIAAILAATGARSVSNKAVGLAITNKHEEKSFVELGLSHLGEAHTAFQKNLCESDFCYSMGASLKRGGGFSQKSDGVEDDYFRRMDLNYSSVKYTPSYEDQTYVFYSGQRYDEDSIGLFSEAEPESLNASSNGSILFLGKKYKFKDAVLKASYLVSYRSQENSDVPTKFSQRGEVFEVEGEYKNIGLRVFNERYDLFLNKDSDTGAVLNFKSVINKINYSLDIGVTTLRNEFGSVEVDYKNWGLFAKAVPASLFQSSLNESGGFENLKTQNILGLRYYERLLKNKQIKLNLKASYSRTFDFIDYELSSNSYKNLNEIENALLKIEALYLGSSVFVQYQIARNVSTGAELVQRPDWTLGLRVKEKLRKTLTFSGALKLIGERKAFDGSLLDHFWESSVALGFKEFSLSAVNAFNEDQEVYRGLGRRPLTFELKYQKTF